MNKEQAVQILKQLHNIAIQKGVYGDVEAVNQVTQAIQVVSANVLPPIE